MKIDGVQHNDTLLTKLRYFDLTIYRSDYCYCST